MLKGETVLEDVTIYRRIDYAFRAEGGVNEAGELPSSELMLGTYASSNFIHKIFEMAASRNLRICAIVPVDSNIGLSYELIRRLRICWPDVRRLVDFHIVIRDCRDCGYADYSEDRKVSFAELVSNAHGMFDGFSCDEVRNKGLSLLLARVIPDANSPAPLYRELAIELAPAPYFMLIDADIHISKDLLFEFKRCMNSKLLQSDGGFNRTVFVAAGDLVIDDESIFNLIHAAFEKRGHLSYPRSKSELLAMLEKGDARV
jgi:hypothetical protein